MNRLTAGGMMGAIGWSLMGYTDLEIPGIQVVPDDGSAIDVLVL